MKNFKEVYTLPFHGHQWVLDKQNTFCFEFNKIGFPIFNKMLLDVINGEETFDNDTTYHHLGGVMITIKKKTNFFKCWMNFLI